MDLLVGVVLPGDEECGQLEPHVRLVLEVEQRLQDRLQVRSADLVIEALREGLEVHVGGVHVCVELGPWLGADIARRHSHALHASFSARQRDVDGVLVEDDRIVIGECHSPAPEGTLPRGR